MADKADVQRLVPGAAAGNQRYLARLELPPPDEFPLGAQHDDIGVRRRQTVQ